MALVAVDDEEELFGLIAEINFDIFLQLSIDCFKLEEQIDYYSHNYRIKRFVLVLLNSQRID